MLAPETRVLLTDALRPPDGYRVDLAVATTYSLDLTALLLAPMSFALHETSDALEAVDGVALLESLRRYAQRTTVFCQAGGIHLPARYSPLLQFLEQSIYEVTPPNPRRIFHPKVWMIRFVAAEDRYLHRVLVLSRNLTFDRCWDTLLRLDEREAGFTTASPDTKPLVTFLRALPDLAASVDSTRRAQVADLCGSLTDASFDVPDGFTALEFLPLGLEGATWPFPQSADRALLISPFLDISAATRVANIAREPRIVSRPESFDRIGPKAVGPAAQAWTLQRPAEIGLGDDSSAAERFSHEGAAIRDGLHAKTFVFDTGATSKILTGSANLTSAAFDGNVEFDVLLTGPTTSCGVASIWDGSAESPGLSRLAEPYEPKVMSAEELTRANLALEVDRFHTDLATRGARLDVSTAGENLVDLVLDLAGVDGPGATHVWPISLSRIQGRFLQGQAQPRWEAIDRRNITPFVAVETVAGSGSTQVSIRMVLKADLNGDVGDRRALAMSEILRDSTDVLRYLALLLSDPSLDLCGTGSGDRDPEDDWQRRAGVYDLVVLEPLMRASLRNDEALKRVANLIQELQEMQGGSKLLPEGFREIWDAVWEGRGPVG
jgi:hypothetical protein